MIGRAISRSWSVRPLILVVRIMGRRFGTDALSVMTLVVALVGLESEWVPGLARVSAAWDLMSKIRDLVECCLAFNYRRCFGLKIAGDHQKARQCSSGGLVLDGLVVCRFLRHCYLD